MACCRKRRDLRGGDLGPVEQSPMAYREGASRCTLCTIAAGGSHPIRPRYSCALTLD